MSTVFPIQFEDKENSASLLAYLQQFGAKGYLTAEEINLFRDALNELNTTSIKNKYYQHFDYNGTGENAVIPIPATGYTEIRLKNEDLTSVSGFDGSLLTGALEQPFQGKQFLLWNNTGNGITIKHGDNEIADIPFLLLGEVDIVLPDKQMILFKYDAAGFYEVMKSWVNSSGSDCLYQTIQWKSFANIYKNYWISTQSYYSEYKQSTLISAGTGLVPNSTLYMASTCYFIPTGYIVDSIEFEISFIDGIYPSDLQIYIDRSENNAENPWNGVFNSINLVNESINISAASNKSKYFKTLTIAQHSLPTLSKSFLQIGIRETTSTNVEYCLNFNVKYKKV